MLLLSLTCSKCVTPDVVASARGVSGSTCAQRRPIARIHPNSAQQTVQQSGNNPRLITVVQKLCFGWEAFRAVCHAVRMSS